MGLEEVMEKAKVEGSGSGMVGFGDLGWKMARWGKIVMEGQDGPGREVVDGGLQKSGRHEG